MPAQLQVKHIADTNIDHTEEALIPLLELALVENLDGDHRGILDGAKTK